MSLADFKGKTVVLEWNNYGCPFVQKHYKSGNMQTLQKTYTQRACGSRSSRRSGPRGRQFPAQLTKALPRRRGPRAVMVEPGPVGLAYGAKTTPHMYIVDPRGRLAYNGGIDDKPLGRLADIKTAKNYVVAALGDAVAGKPVSNGHQRAVRLHVKYK